MPVVRLGIDSRGAEQGARQFEGAIGRVGGATRKLIGLFGTLSTGLVATEALRTLTEYETGLIAVGKTADISGAELAAFGDDVQRLRAELRAVETQDLLEVAEAAGQLGVKGVDNILAFTRTLAILERTTDVVGDEGARAIARVLNVTGDGIEGVERFGNVLVALGNNSAATEAEILSLATKIGQSIGQFDVNSSNVLALSAALRSLGVEAEVAGSQVFETFRTLDEAIREGGSNAQLIAQLIGEPVDQLRASFDGNAFDFFRRVVEGLGELSRGQTSQVLNQLGLDGARLNRVIPPLVANVEQFERALQLTREELRENNAASREFANQQRSLGASFTNLRENIRDVFRDQGELGRSLRDLVNDAGDAVQILRGQGDTLDDVSDRARSFAGAAGLVSSNVGDIVTATGALFAVQIGRRIAREGSGFRKFASDARAAARAAEETFLAAQRSAPGAAIAREIADFDRSFRSLGVLANPRELDAFERRFLAIGTASNRTTRTVGRSTRAIGAAFRSIPTGAVVTGLEAATFAAIVFGDELLDAIVPGRRAVRELSDELKGVDKVLREFFGSDNPTIVDIEASATAIDGLITEVNRRRDSGAADVQVRAVIPQRFRDEFQRDLVESILASAPSASVAFQRLDRAFDLRRLPVLREGIADLFLSIEDLNAANLDGLLSSIDAVNAPVEQVLLFLRELRDGFQERGDQDLVFGPLLPPGFETAASSADAARSAVDELADSGTRLTSNVDALIESLNGEAAAFLRGEAATERFRIEQEALKAAQDDGIQGSEKQAEAAARVADAFSDLERARDVRTIEDYVDALATEVAVLEAEAQGQLGRAEILRLQASLVSESIQLTEAQTDAIQALVERRETLNALDSAEPPIEPAFLDSIDRQIDQVTTRLLALRGQITPLQQLVREFIPTTGNAFADLQLRVTGIEQLERLSDLREAVALAQRSVDEDTPQGPKFLDSIDQQLAQARTRLAAFRGEITPVQELARELIPTTGNALVDFQLKVTGIDQVEQLVGLQDQLAFDQLTAELDAQAAAFRRLTPEQEAAILLAERGIEVTGKNTQALAEQIEELRTLGRIRQVSATVGASLIDPVRQAIQSEDFSDLGADLVRSFGFGLIEELALSPLQDGLSGLVEGFLRSIFSVEDTTKDLGTTVGKGFFQSILGGLFPGGGDAADGAAAGAAGGAAGGLLGFLKGLFGGPAAKGKAFTSFGVVEHRQGGIPGLGDLPDLGGRPAFFVMPDGRIGSIREGGLEEGIFPLRHPEGSGVRLLGTSEVLQVGRDERGNLGVALGLDVFERVLGREAVEAATGAVSPFRQGGIPSGASDRARLGFVPGPITASTFGREQAFPSQGFGRSGVLDMRRADRALDTFAERLERTTSRLEALENRAVRDPRVSDEQRRSQQQFRALRIRGGVRA